MIKQVAHLGGTVKRLMFIGIALLCACGGPATTEPPPPASNPDPPWTAPSPRIRLYYLSCGWTPSAPPTQPERIVMDVTLNGDASLRGPTPTAIATLEALDVAVLYRFNTNVVRVELDQRRLPEIVGAEGGAESAVTVIDPAVTDLDLQVVSKFGMHKSVTEALRNLGAEVNEAESYEQYLRVVAEDALIPLIWALDGVTSVSARSLGCAETL